MSSLCDRICVISMNFNLKRVTYYFIEDVSFYYNIFISSKLTGPINFVEIFGFVEFFFFDVHKFTLHSKDYAVDHHHYRKFLIAINFLFRYLLPSI